MAKLVPKIYPNDVDDNTPIGVSFPLTVGTQEQNYITTDQVHDNLRNLILTMKEERPMQPEFGSDIMRLCFEPIDDEQLSIAARETIIDAVDQWMPSIQIINVEASSEADENRVLIRVSYAIEGWETNNVLNLTVRV